jgi:hypothetical protein
MKPEIEELIELYKNREEDQARMDVAAKAQAIPELAEFLNVQNKITFDRRRQRAELLKLNERFLEELSGIKNRLGEKFFKLLEEEIGSVDYESPAKFFAASRNIVAESDFAELVIDSRAPPVLDFLGRTPIY